VHLVLPYVSDSKQAWQYNTCTPGFVPHKHLSIQDKILRLQLRLHHVVEHMELALYAMLMTSVRSQRRQQEDECNKLPAWRTWVASDQKVKLNCCVHADACPTFSVCATCITQTCWKAALAVISGLHRAQRWVASRGCSLPSFLKVQQHHHFQATIYSVLASWGWKLQTP